MLSHFADKAIKTLEKQIKSYKKAGRSVFILCDTHTQEHCLPVLREYISFDFEENILIMPAGEENKNIQTSTALWQELSEKNADRNAVLICLGGGVVCDMGGFVAATFKRGIDYIFVPTSLMAQIDACIGGKNAINLNGIKNQIGLFHQPKMVFTIPAFLATLPEREILSGFAEMLKHGLIADKTYWEKLSVIQDVSQIIRSTELLKKSIDIKTAICNVDMYDMGERKKLNFGHTIGHALESFALYAGRHLSHGEAVALGMMVEAHISCQKKLINEKELALITNVLSRFFPPFSIEKKDYASILFYLQKDKKKINNNLNFTLLNAIGKAVINQQVSQIEIEQALDCLGKI
jgi:3-dehydroquinate synthase